MSTSVCSSQSRCVSGILDSPQLSPVFFGLTSIEGLLSIDPGKFVCCEGSGAYFDDQVNAVRRCDIVQRLRQLHNLLGSMHSFWPERGYVNMDGMSQALPQDNYQLLQEFLKGSKQAWAYRVAPYKGPSWLWAAAAALVWRQGLRCQVLSFASPHKDAMPLSGVGNPDIILVEGIHKLSEPQRALLLEEIIGQAYNSQTRLVVEFAYTPASQEQEPERVGFSTKGIFAKRVQRLKNQDPLAFLEPNTRSRLEYMCRVGG